MLQRRGKRTQHRGGGGGLFNTVPLGPGKFHYRCFDSSVLFGPGNVYKVHSRLFLYFPRDINIMDVLVEYYTASFFF